MALRARIFSQGLRAFSTTAVPPAASFPSPTSATIPRVTTRTVQSWPRRGEGQRLVMLTAYDYPTGLHAERAGVDVVLVGDSLGMVVLGHDTTQPVTIDDMAHHTAATRRAVRRALLVADLPFGTYETSPRDAMRAAYSLVKGAGADAVKLEGGSPERARIARAVVDGGVAVMGHVGLTPQAVSVAGGFRAVGRDAAAAARVLDEALALQDAGVFAVVIECVPAEVARIVTDALDVPTIGIGAGGFCTGQVLVYHDMLGLMAHPHHSKVAPKFSKQFANLGHIIDSAIRGYSDEVRKADFPAKEHSPYRIAESELQSFEEYAGRRRESLAEPAADVCSPHVDRGDLDDIRLY